MCYREAGCCVKVLKATIPDGNMKRKKKRSAPFIHPPQDGHAHMCDHYRRISDQL